jgi:hypothetical protein
MKNYLTSSIAALLFGSLALTASAIPITGQINFQGNVVLTPNMLGAVESVAPATNVRVTSVEGTSYPATLVGDTGTYAGFTVATGAKSITPLWSVTDTGGTGFNYSFDLLNISTSNQASNNLFLAGSGTLRISGGGFDPTPGLWTYNITSADGSPTSGVFSFQSNNTAQGQTVPDGGSTVILLGAGFLATVLAYRRKFGA